MNRAPYESFSPDTAVLNRTLGAILIGGIATSVLYGVSCLQCFIFFQRPGKSFPLLNYAVVFLWILDTAHLVILVWYTLDWYMVKNFGNAIALTELPWSSAGGGIIITTVSDGVVRFCFTYRLWVLSSHNKWLTFPLLALQSNLWGVGLGSGIKGLFTPTLSKLEEEFWLIYWVLALIIVIDSYIAISLCFFLFRSRRCLATRKTESLVNLLIIYTINTGLLTSVFALLATIVHILRPHDYAFISMFFILEKLYFNSLMASLNARDWIKEGPGILTIELSRMNKEHGQSAFVSSQIVRPVGQVSSNFGQEEMEKSDTVV